MANDTIDLGEVAIDASARAFCVLAVELRSPSAPRSKNRASARASAALILRKLGRSYPEIAEALAMVDHTTARGAVMRATWNPDVNTRALTEQACTFARERLAAAGRADLALRLEP